MGSRVADNLAWFALFHMVVWAIPVISEISIGLFFEPGTAIYYHWYRIDWVLEAWLEVYVDIVGFGVVRGWTLLYSPVIWVLIKLITGKWRFIPWKKPVS